MIFSPSSPPLPALSVILVLWAPYTSTLTQKLSYGKSHPTSRHRATSKLLFAHLCLAHWSYIYYLWKDWQQATSLLYLFLGRQYSRPSGATGDSSKHKANKSKTIEPIKPTQPAIKAPQSSGHETNSTSAKQTT